MIKGSSIENTGNFTMGGKTWNQTYGGPGDESAQALIQTVDGDFVLAGATESYGAGSSDMWLVKTDRNGIAQWNRTFGGIEYEDAFSLIQTADGGFALAGVTWSFGVGSSDMWLVKTDRDGIMQWNRTFGGIEYEDAFSLIQTADGGFALAGVTWSYGTGGSDMWLVKIDRNGIAQWNRTFGGIENEEVFSLIRTVDGGFALAGATWSFGVGSSDMWLVKTDRNGIAQWNKTYGRRGKDGVDAVLTATNAPPRSSPPSCSFCRGVSNLDELDHSSSYLI